MATVKDADHDKATPRGRPRFDTQRHVSDALLDAAEAGLREKSYDDLTSREIASLAGANPAMIKYYFDGKDGLFSTLIENALKQISAELDNLERDILGIEGSPTRALITVLARHYYACAPLYKVVMDELRNRNSGIRQRYLRRGSRTFLQVSRILQKLVAAGVYKPATDVRRAAFTVTCLISTPVSMSPVIEQFGFTLDELQGDAWLDYISALLDREFLV